MSEYHGRRQIFTSLEEITRENVSEFLEKALDVHELNVAEIDYLYDYFRGKTPVLEREKTIRDDILNRINENRAKEIVDFKTAYLVGEDVIYSTSTEEYNEAVTQLNQFMRICGKSTKDYSLVEWQNIAGTAYRVALPRGDEEYIEEGNAPFNIAVPDPRDAFVAYSSGIYKEPIASVYMVTDDDDITHYWVYTHAKCFVLNSENEDIEEYDWTLWYLPIVEYPANNVRMGAFEVVLDLLDAIDELNSSRLDGIQQFIQALLVLINCKLPEGYNSKTLAELGLIELPSSNDMPADIKMLCEQLDQEQTQKLKDDFHDAVLTICAMPNRNGSSSTSDNGIAVIYRDGWETAEAAARTSKKMIEQSELEMLRLVLRICRETGTLDIPLSAIHVDFTKNHYENLTSKANVLVQLLGNDKVHPLVAYEVCGMFADPNEKYREGMEWYNKVNGTSTEELPAEV